jgi:hypothetical protein
MKVSMQGRPIGYSHTAIDTRREEGEDLTVLRNRSSLQVNVLGETRRIQFSAEATLDDRYRMRTFGFTMDARPYWMNIRGRRQGDSSRFEVTVQSVSGRESLEIEIPDDVILYSPMTEMALRDLKPGESVQVRAFDPGTLSTGLVRMRAVARETLELAGVAHEATRIDVEYRGMTIPSWIDRQGRMLRQETPFGWTLEASTAQEAMGLKVDAESTEMLGQSAVACEGTIDRPRAASRLRLRLYDWPEAATPPPASDRQQVTVGSDRTVELEIVRSAEPDMPEAPGAEAPPPAEFAPYLASTPFVQASHPDMVKKAREVAGDEPDRWRQAQALGDFVYRHVEKVPSISMPSALDVLRVGQGDCNEHTYLFVALARALGIPARIMVGLVHAHGALYYHAWPSVYVQGRWVDMDPTFQQTLADATHVALLDGELADQLSLLALIGRLRAEILEVEYDSD